MTRCTLKILFFLLLAMMLSACMGQSKPANPIYYYTIDYEPHSNSYDSPLPWVLRVHRFSASPPFDTQRIIYADKGLHRNAYGYHQWIAPPGELLPFLLSRDFKYSNALKAILTPDATLPSTHDLYGWVEKFVEKDNVSPRQALLRCHITLVSALSRNPADRILLQKSYQTSAPCNDQTPDALAQAMSIAVAKMNQDIIQDIYRQLSSQ